MQTDAPMTPEDAAEYLGVTTRTLARWRAECQGPCYLKRGRLIRYERTDLDAFLRAGRVEPVRESADPAAGNITA